MSEIQPLDHRVLVKRLPEDGPIVLTDSEGSRKALVIACGPGKILKNGMRRPMGVKPGQIIYLCGVGWTDPDYRDRDEMWITEDDIAFIIEPEAHKRRITQSLGTRFPD